jgi:hypothetical protein
MSCPRGCPDRRTCAGECYQPSRPQSDMYSPTTFQPLSSSPGFAWPQSSVAPHGWLSHNAGGSLHGPQTPQFLSTFQTAYPPPAEPAIFRTVLGDSTSQFINITSPVDIPGAGSKRKRTTSASTARKRTNAPIPPTPSPSTSSGPTQLPGHLGNSAPAVYGVGPHSLEPNENTAPTFHLVFTNSQATSGYGSLMDPGRGRTTAATDVWYFVRGLTSREKPDILPRSEKMSQERPNRREFDFLGCKLCE